MKHMKPILFCGVLVAWGLAAAGQGQHIGFEAASVKVHKGPITRVGFRVEGQRFWAYACTLKMLISRSYSMPELRIIDASNGAPERYDIEAAVSMPIDINVSRQMLRALLDERFQLKTHQSSQDQPVYDLVVTNGGPKFKRSLDQDPPPDTTPIPGSVSCEGLEPPPGRLAAGKQCWVGRSVLFSSFVNALSLQVGRTVIDKTALTGRFDLQVDWAPDRNQPSISPRDIASDAALFTALQDQLGIKLESAIAPIEILIVDDAKPPDAN